MNNIKKNEKKSVAIKQQEHNTLFGNFYNKPSEEYRVNNQGKTERLFEGQWEIDMSGKND